MMKLFSVPALFAGALAMDTKTGRIGTDEVFAADTIETIEVDSANEMCMSHKVVTYPSQLIHTEGEDQGKKVDIGHGAFARVAIKRGEVIERGPARQINCNGKRWQMVFTWIDPARNIPTEDRDTWAICAGHAAFYNTASTDNANTKMYRAFHTMEDGTKLSWFEIRAIRDIKVGEILLHTYVSLQWRPKFKEIKDSVDAVRFPNLLDILKDADKLDASATELSEEFVTKENAIFTNNVHVQDNKAYAAVTIASDAVVETGLFRLRPHVVTQHFDEDLSLWRIAHGDDVHNHALLKENWALVSGKHMMYNAVPIGDERVNVRIEYTYEDVDGSFKIIALREIIQGEPLYIERLGHGPLSAEVVRRFITEVTINESNGEATAEPALPVDRKITIAFEKDVPAGWSSEGTHYNDFLAFVGVTRAESRDLGRAGEDSRKPALPQAEPRDLISLVRAGEYNRELGYAAGPLFVAMLAFYMYR